MCAGFFTHTLRPPRRRTTSCVGHLDQQHRGQAPLQANECPAQRLRLSFVAREAVEQEAIAGVVHADPLGDHPHDHLVGHELSRLHVPLRLPAERGAVRHLRTQHVARRDVREREVALQTVRLGALARTRRAEEDQVQLGHVPPKPTWWDYFKNPS